MLIKTKDTCNGKLRIDGTRLTYDSVIEILSQMTIFEALEQYPSLTIDGIIDCLKHYKGDNK